MAKDDDVFVVSVKLNRDQLAAVMDEVHGKLEFEIKIKMAKKQLGDVLAALPPKVHPQIDRLVERDFAPPRRHPHRSGHYEPIPGTAPHAIMQVMRRGPVDRPSDVVRQLPKFAERAVSTSFYLLRDRGWLKKLPNGGYDLGPNAPQPSKPKAKPKAKKKKPKPPTVMAAPKSTANGKGAEA